MLVVGCDGAMGDMTHDQHCEHSPLAAVLDLCLTRGIIQ